MGPPLRMRYTPFGCSLKKRRGVVTGACTKSHLLANPGGVLVPLPPRAKELARRAKPHTGKTPPADLCSRGCDLLFGIGRADRSTAQQVVHTDTVKVGEFVKRSNRNIQIAQFIVGICGLMNIQKRGKFFLGKVAVFAQITNTKLIHINHPKILWVKGISHISF